MTSDKQINSLPPFGERSDRDHSGSTNEKESSKDTTGGDYSNLETFLQLKMRTRNERTVIRLPNGEYLAECNTCKAGTVFEYYEDAVLALHDHRCFQR